MDEARVLFICNHNSARSLMAEAYLNQLGAGRFAAQSAGFELRPANPLVVEAMAEVGIDLSRKEPQSVFDVYRRGGSFNYVIAVCATHVEVNCPIFPGVHKNRLRVVFPDPARLSGPEDKQLEAVRGIRDDIREQIGAFLAWAAAGAAGVPGPRWDRM